MLKRIFCYTAILTAAACLAQAQTPAPPAPSPKDEASVELGGKKISVKYSAPSVRGRKIFGDGGLISGDPQYPVWRAGANDATALHTDGDITIGSVKVPAGDYTLFVSLKDPNAWELIISKDTGEWGLAYKDTMDLGRTKMAVSKTPSLVERLKYEFDPVKAGITMLRLSWENESARVPIRIAK